MLDQLLVSATFPSEHRLRHRIDLVVVRAVEKGSAIQEVCICRPKSILRLFLT
jgi:hypothetical protein